MFYQLYQKAVGKQQKISTYYSGSHLYKLLKGIPLSMEEKLQRKEREQVKGSDTYYFKKRKE